MSTARQAKETAMTRPRDESGRFVSERSIPRYRVTVWDTREGDIEEKLWEASEADLDDLEAKYRGEPFIHIEVEDL